MESLVFPAVPDLLPHLPSAPPGSCASLAAICDDHTCAAGNAADPGVADGFPCGSGSCTDDQCCVGENPDTSTRVVPDLVSWSKGLPVYLPMAPSSSRNNIIFLGTRYSK